MKRFWITAALLLGVLGCAVSTQQEVQLGTDYAAQINRQLPIVTDPEINRYISVLGDSISRLADDRQLQWHFYVVDSREVNAFAVPGGYIYVNRGLIERADDLSQLAGVLGHEIGHVTRRHSIKQMQNAQKANVLLTLGCVLMPQACASEAAGAAVQLGGGALFAKFSRNDENQADEEGIRNVVRAGIDPSGIPAMFRKLIEERQRRPAGVDAWFATHPLEETRVAETEKVIAQMDPAILRTLTKDSRNFQAFKARLQALPSTGR